MTLEIIDFEGWIVGLIGKPDLSGVKTAENPRTDEKRRQAFRKSDGGAVAIEFAIVAPVFFLMVMSIFELCLNYTADRLFNSGLDNAARLIKTGQVRASPTYGSAEFKQELCNQPIMFLFDCDNVLVDVRTVAAFQEDSYETNPDGSVNSGSFGFAPGGRTTINVVRAFYEWPTVLNWVQFGQATGYQIDVFDENSRIIAASTAFLNEPF